MKHLLFLLIFCLCFPPPQASAKEAVPAEPFGPHCLRVGPLPLDPDYCGCTIGTVYYRGQPVAGAPITLQVGSQMTQTVSQLYPEYAFPYYSTDGESLGARHNDIMTVTATFAGQTISRPFRAIPDGSNKEQDVSLVIQDPGVWVDWVQGGYTRTLTADGTKLWAGGPAGLLAIDSSTGISTSQAIPWSEASVVAVAVAPNQHSWAAGPRQLAELDGNQWQDRPVPFAETIRALVIDPSNGKVWAGGGDGSGALAFYDGNWHTVKPSTIGIDAPITTMLMDATGTLWVGTFGSGLYRHAGSQSDANQGWSQLRVSDGLASDYVLSLAADAQALWVGTRPYQVGDRLYGGVSRYAFAPAPGLTAWRTYSTTQGLPADTLLSPAPASINALAIDAAGNVWAGTAFGVHLLATPDRWVTEYERNGDSVRALASISNTAISHIAIQESLVQRDLSGAPVTNRDQAKNFAGAPDRSFLDDYTAISHTVVAAHQQGGVRRLDRSQVVGKPPIVQIDTVGPIDLALSATQAISATASDPDGVAGEREPQIIAWDWRSDRDGPLCTTVGVCLVGGGELSVGTHRLSLRVQDDEGVWSESVAITVTNLQQVYLPLLRR